MHPLTQHRWLKLTSGYRRWPVLLKNWTTGLLAGLAVLCVLAPFSQGESRSRIGVFLLLTAAIEIAHGFRRATTASQRNAWSHGVITLMMGLLLLSAPMFASRALVIFFAGWFFLDCLRLIINMARGVEDRRHVWNWLSVVINLGLGLLLILYQGPSSMWCLAIAAGLRIIESAVGILRSPIFTAQESGATIINDLGLTDQPQVMQLAQEIAEQETARQSIDRGWIIAFIITLFAIHLGRMGFDRSSFGVVSPVFAVIGDLFMALLIAFFIMIPAIVASNKLTRYVERQTWAWSLTTGPLFPLGWLRAIVRWVLTWRLRVAIRLRQARYSFRTALSRGLQLGLPVVAIIAATVPMWGMSWYFDTENWAAGIWNSWAEHRTDTWRSAMLDAVEVLEQDTQPEQRFAIDPGRFDTQQDFSFLVIGDPGEGDASQLSLKSQWLDVVQRPEVKFAVISSDVVYPTGAMRHYETNFWLPFMGTQKPIYAIPGNHDWYDANEAFVATFFKPAAARLALRARIEVDNRLTTTTEQTIERLIDQATRYRELYQLPTQQQEAPFFQFQTEQFALFAVDTGVARTVDDKQLQWLKQGLQAAQGKLKLVILGHPFYAGGRDTTLDDESFIALQQLLREHRVAVVMAGDTHDLEYYREELPNTKQTMHHVVNGGGGAYLSFGTALAWPKEPVTKDWSYYPSRVAVEQKIESTTPTWKRPAWWWTKNYGAWPFSAEWLSAAFDSNVAPFMQSFIEVRVEPSRQQLRLIPYGVNGRLRWSEFDKSQSTLSEQEFVEWVIRLPTAE
jgi:uncharacterized membrane protein HdeD (DUF308 family)/3',5'-cyclic AMP phosphodiesterase CpdA